MLAIMSAGAILLVSSMFIEGSFLTMSLMLLLLSMVSSALLGTITQNSWLFFMLTLVYAGGVMLLFIYLSILTKSSNPLNIYPLFSLLVIGGALSGATFLCNYKYYLETSLSLFSKSMTMIYSVYNFPMILFFMMYILMLLIASITLMSEEGGPLCLSKN